MATVSIITYPLVELRGREKMKGRMRGRESQSGREEGGHWRSKRKYRNGQMMANATKATRRWSNAKERERERERERRK